MSIFTSVDPYDPNLNSLEGKDWERFQELRTRGESGDDESALAACKN